MDEEQQIHFKLTQDQLKDIFDSIPKNEPKCMPLSLWQSPEDRRIWLTINQLSDRIAKIEEMLQKLSDATYRD